MTKIPLKTLKSPKQPRNEKKTKIPQKRHDDQNTPKIIKIILNL